MLFLSGRLTLTSAFFSASSLDLSRLTRAILLDISSLLHIELDILTFQFLHIALIDVSNVTKIQINDTSKKQERLSKLELL